MCWAFRASKISRPDLYKSWAIELDLFPHASTRSLVAKERKQQPALTASIRLASRPGIGYAATQSGTMSPPPPPLGSYPESHAQERPPDEQRRKSVPWGLNPWLFAAMAALIGMPISGAIFGGVMGSMLANSSQR
ncbi:hypothetical protein MAPG_05960 [Magnaporthiopsis poae ATCC 64411]|uniref:Uncharacterized protein n=1 Tax=Magnaporthiopsis poae (strain ATCC 64411 / 73-15) TaxID=644358 RepID=A0A0C4E0S6_MAGP6|nr:hypothetical protein MAPG_05960 [Magnaporthiopsis poae ATCC 64411]